MISEDFGIRLNELDRDFCSKSVPLVLRPLEAFHVLVGREDREDSTLGSLNQIVAWYIEKYGEAAVWDGRIGSQPILIRGSLYTARIPFTSETVMLKIADYIENLPRYLADTLSSQEWVDVGSSVLAASEDFGALYNLETRPSLLSAEQRAFVRRAWYDLRNSATVIKEDTQGSIFHAHQAAEKFVKAALLRVGVGANVVRKLQHKLEEASLRLSESHVKFATMLPWAKALDLLLGSMDIRYSQVVRSQANGVSAFSAARSICGFLARQWQLDAERGAPDIQFELGKYYRDYSGRKFRFNGQYTDGEGGLITILVALEHGVPGMMTDAEIRFVGHCSFYYVPLSDAETISRLERRYRELPKN